jgi:hypothetical protein
MAKDWTAVKFGLASQVAQLATLSERASALIGPEDRPAAFFARLRAEGLADDALLFAAQALPRLSAVKWACGCVSDPPGPSLSPADAKALRAALDWVEEPCEAYRRAAQSAADAAEYRSPEAFAALAAFWSGGSIAPETSPQPVPAAANLCGKAAYAAAALASARGEAVQAAARKNRYLDMAAALACGAGSDQNAAP